jgi:hypothetical protein
MVHLPKLPSQFKNLFWDFRVVGVVVFARYRVHPLLYLLAGHQGSRILSVGRSSRSDRKPPILRLATFVVPS